MRLAMGLDVPLPIVRRLSLVSLCGSLGTPHRNEVSGTQRGRERHAAPAADAHGGRLAARAQPPRPLSLPRPADAMELADVPRHRPLAFDKMESLIKEMQDPESGVPVKCQKLFLSIIPSAFMGYDLIEWLMERFNLDETTNVEAINLANQLCQHGYFFPVNDLKILTLKDDSSLYRFQSPYYWPWQGTRVAGSGSNAPSLGPDNIEYAIYLVKRTLRNKQRHALDDYEQEALANLKKNLAAKWDFITMQAEEQVRLAKDRKKGDKIVSDSQERAYWRVARPPPGVPSALEPCPVPVRARNPRPKKRTIQQLTREIEHLKTSLDRTRVKTSIALEALLAYSETFAPYDPWLTPPQPSNPWVSDDTLFWQINSPIVEVPSEKRVQRWALSIEELVSDPTGLQEFTSFLRKEYSHENIRFWLAVMDLRRTTTKHIPKKLEEIYEEFLKPGAPCEINIDGATAERVAEGLRSGSRYALDHAADHVYGLLLKKDCYPRFVRSDHFQRLLAEGKNVHQKKAKFFNFGGQVKKKPGASAAGSAGSGAPLSRRRGSDRSLSGSAHELAVCAAQPPRAPEPPPHSHSQSNLCEIPFRDPVEDGADDVAPWENAPREVYGATRRRQDSAADSGSSSSDVSAAAAVAERARRLPQQSTLDGGLRGAPPPLRRLSAVEPRHLAPLASPPHSPRALRPAPAPAPPPAAPPHPTPTISVSSAPDDELPESLAHTDEPPSVFASADATPTEPGDPIEDRCAQALDKTLSTLSYDNSRTADVSKVEVKVHSADEPSSASAPVAELCAERGAAQGAERGATQGAERGAAQGAERESAQGPERGTEQDAERGATQGATKSAERGTEQGAERGATQGATKSAERGTEQGAERGATQGATQGAERCYERPGAPEGDSAPTRRALSREPSTMKEISPASSKDSSKIGELPESGPEREGATEAPQAEGAASGAGARAPVAPLAVGEDIGADDDNVDKVPSAPAHTGPAAAAGPDATTLIAHTDAESSVSESNNVKRDGEERGARRPPNDVCPWEDE